ncbi:hypothetical protein [Coleofasciculus sp.]|uniref:hypothetical protein n=1 Tax=Coleofasciculus sp. TaxID=3100458 RepID=UPI0039F81FAC
MMSNNNVFTGLLITVFFSFGLIGILNHEMWIDELQAWLIARESTSLGDLFNNLRYEIHPGLWYLCLYLTTRFTQNPVAMQIFHLMLATGAIYIFARFSPFTKLQKVLFSFGYFPFYEYGIISRNYTLGILLIFLFCALYKTRTKSYLALFIILALLSNTNIIGLIIAISLGITLAFEAIFYKSVINLRFPKKQDIVLSVLVFTLGIGMAVSQLIPPADFAYKVNGLKKISLSSALKPITAIWKSYIPIPDILSYNFWNTNLLTTSLLGNLLSVILSLVLLVFFVGIFIRRPIPLFLYVSGTAFILLFDFSTSYSGFFLRHYGYLYILLISCLWISSYYNQSNFLFRWSKKLSYFSKKNKKLIILIILLAQMIAGTFAYTMDLFYPFSSAKSAAQLIESQQISDLPIVANYTASPLSAFLNKKIYFLETEQLGSFIKWDKNWLKTRWNEKTHRENINKFIKQNNTTILLILDYEISTKNYKLNIEEFANFTNSIVYDHSHYYMYLISPQYR